jgi:hypothetical protein
MELGECVYCGEQRELTRDHVPPRCLFSKPGPSELITVPCCTHCNGDFQQHDEYFRIAITTGIDREKFPKENADSVRAINKLARPASLRFARSLLETYDAKSAQITIDRQRIELVRYRITRGLFFHHKNVRMPQHIGFVFRELTENVKTNVEGRDRIERLAADLTTIGPGTFRYAHEALFRPDPFGTFWLMRFCAPPSYKSSLRLLTKTGLVRFPLANLCRTVSPRAVHCVSSEPDFLSMILAMS